MGRARWSSVPRRGILASSPAGAKADHHFVIENSYEETAHIKSVTSSCQCSKPTVSKQFLKTWEKAEIIITLDTRAEPGRKDGTVEVEFDLPYPAKVQFHVHSFIRGDVVVQPGVVAFGTVNQGAGASRELKITYAGRTDWKITKVECANPFIKASAVETSRLLGTPSRIAYGLSVELKKDAPPGYIREPLVLVTNDLDARSARVPVNIEGLVATVLTVRPASLTTGAAEIGVPVTSNLVVQGHDPFRIVAIRSSDDRFEGKAPAGPKQYHIVPDHFLGQRRQDGARQGKCKNPHRDRSCRSGAARDRRHRRGRAGEIKRCEEAHFHRSGADIPVCREKGRHIRQTGMSAPPDAASPVFPVCREIGPTFVLPPIPGSNIRRDPYNRPPRLFRLPALQTGVTARGRKLLLIGLLRRFVDSSQRSVAGEDEKKSVAKE